MNTPPPLNIPFWSLNYEAWYYAIFGAAVLVRGAARWPATLALAVASGPNVLLLMPAWLVGMVLYRLQPRIPLSSEGALTLFLGSGLLYLLLLKFDPGAAFSAWVFSVSPQIGYGLGWSVRFPGDWLMALVVAMNFAAASRLGRYGAWLIGLQRPIRGVASYTLSIYLFHMPLTAFFVAALGLQGWVLALALAVSIVALGRVTEHRRAALRRILSLAGQRASVMIAPSLRP